MATEMSGVPSCGNGDGHEHGCLDALAISLSSVSMCKHLDFQLVILRLKEAGLDVVRGACSPWAEGGVVRR